MYPKLSTNVSKLGNKIASLNLPAGLTCREDSPCSKHCYAKRGNFAFPVVRKGLAGNYQAYIDNPDEFFKILDSQLTYIPYKFFRWHSSGDIIDERYLDGMVKLARKHKATSFLCFTKQYEIINAYFNKHRKPKNLTIVLSNWGEFICENPHNFPTSWVYFPKEDNWIPENAMKCSGYCGDCVNTEHSCWHLNKGESVVFRKH